ncbi:MAG: hypothetical protein HGB33_11115, partial [Syntrophaceae bacterium]|nr:hypothetical protein [Syntrophaceae bacterium]
MQSINNIMIDHAIKIAQDVQADALLVCIDVIKDIAALPEEIKKAVGVIIVTREEDELPEDVCQQVTRFWAEEDRDTVTGLLRARLQPHERSHSVHVAFCPPMLRRPEVSVAQLS